MYKIYKITNTVNNKVYIGKTGHSLEKRFKEHISEAVNNRHKNRPLYRAISKHGIENFKIELIEETDSPEEREVYWITYYKSYGSLGYNATKGGDGKPYVDLDKVLDCLLKNNLDHMKTAKELGHDRATVVRIAKEVGFFVEIGYRTGADHHKTILTEQDVENIRRLYVPKKIGKRKIAKILNLSVDAIDGVVRSRSWNK